MRTTKPKLEKADVIPFAPQPVIDALNHVRGFYPDVMIVVFSSACRWHYMTEDFEAPNFDGRIDVGVLEDACDSLVGFPAVFEVIDRA